MLLRSLSWSLLTIAALCAGCAQMNSSAMGAGAEAGTVCRDGAILPPHSPCALHGGVNAGASTAAPSTAH